MSIHEYLDNRRGSSGRTDSFAPTFTHTDDLLEVIRYLAVAAVHKDRNSSESVKSFGETAKLFTVVAICTASYKSPNAYNFLPALGLLLPTSPSGAGAQIDTQRLLSRINQLRLCVFGRRLRLQTETRATGLGFMHAGSPLQMPLPDSMVGTPLDRRASHPTRLNLIYSSRWSAYLRPCFPEVDASLRRACIRKYLPH